MPRRPRSAPAASPLGCQLWVEPDDTRGQIRDRMAKARASGLGRLRIFLLWTRIEHEPGRFDFAVYDTVFDEAARAGLGIKATLTANSGPWHQGTPAALHSHTGFLADAQFDAMRRYIRECVTRYAAHPALEQWLLWNEPHGGFLDHTDDNLPRWRAWLRRRYRSRVRVLNERWLTGFRSFDEIPWPELVPHPFHRSGSWSPYRPRLDEMDWRAERLVEQVGWVADEVRRHDPRTELCINPIFTIENQAGGATDLEALASRVDRIGSSYHPVFWHERVGREEYPGMIGAGVRALVEQGGGRPVELTEVISGNSIHTGSRSCAVDAGEIAAFYLSALACGADTVTGWCLNARPRDCEAGEFALLDDNGEVSPRGRSLARLAAAIARCRVESGGWRAADSDLFLALDRRSQAVELLDSEGSGERPRRPGRGGQDGARGLWLLAQRSMEEGYLASPIRLGAMQGRRPRPGQSLWVSHVVAWEEPEARAMLGFARAGGTLVLDALSGRKDTDSACHLPWPGHVVRPLDLRVNELETAADHFELETGRSPAGLAGPVLRTHVAAGAAWEALPWLRFADDKSPALLSRPFGKGRVVYARFPLGPSLLGDRMRDGWLRRLITEVGGPRHAELWCAGGGRGWVTVPVRCEQGHLVCAMGPGRSARGGTPVRFRSRRPGQWHDFWSGEQIATDAQGEFLLPCEEGIAMLWRRD